MATRGRQHTLLHRPIQPLEVRCPDEQTNDADSLSTEQEDPEEIRRRPTRDERRRACMYDD